MKPSLKTITPLVAKKMLEKNVGNRALTPWHVDRLANEMKSGLWKVNGDMIRIGENGRVLDGQHRLHAVIKSQITIQTWVMENMPDDIFDSIDQLQKIRSGGDTLGCAGEKNAYRLSAALILIDKYYTGRVEKSVRYSNGEIEDLLDKYPEARFAIRTDVNSRGIILPSILDASTYLFKLKDPELSTKFLNCVIQGYNLQPGEPALVLREKLLANAMAKAKLNKAHVFALCIKAWNHARAGRNITHLKLNISSENGKLIEFPEVQ